MEPVWSGELVEPFRTFVLRWHDGCDTKRLRRMSSGMTWLRFRVDFPCVILQEWRRCRGLLTLFLCTRPARVTGVCILGMAYDVNVTVCWLPYRYDFSIWVPLLLSPFNERIAGAVSRYSQTSRHGLACHTATHDIHWASRKEFQTTCHGP